MRPVTDGILLIDKEAGQTSHDIVQRIRFACRGKGRLKVGHAGTLDPFATGLLIILIGQGTKLSPFVMPGQKVYLASLELGVETDTLDPTGKVVNMCGVPPLNPDEIRKTADQFVGTYPQRPPAFSSVKFNGTRAYKLARKGCNVVLKPREITVYSLKILSVGLPHITLRVRCSSGTYVRRLASDLGRALGPGAYLRSLRRVQSGPFELEDALPSAEIEERVRDNTLWERIIPMREAIPDMEEIPVSAKTAEKVRQGWQPDRHDLIGAVDPAIHFRPLRYEGPVKLVCDGRLVAIARAATVDAQGGNIKIERVFLS